MQCKLCKEIFNVENSYAFLFSFPKVCPSCTQKYRPVLHQETIPINNGVINYYYLYGENLLNFEQRCYLDRNLKIIYQKLRLLEEEVVIFLDNVELKTIGMWAKYLLPMQKITFFSLVYHDLTKWMFFD